METPTGCMVRKCVPSNSNPKLPPPPPTCGITGNACCPPPSNAPEGASGICTESYNTCVGNTCVLCGNAGQISCDGVCFDGLEVSGACQACAGKSIDLDAHTSGVGATLSIIVNYAIHPKRPAKIQIDGSDGSVGYHAVTDGAASFTVSGLPAGVSFKVSAYLL